MENSATLADGLDGSRQSASRLLAQATEWHTTGDAAFRSLLDALASRASEGNDHCVLALLDLVHRFGLARPPITRVIVDPNRVDDVAQQVLITVERKIAQFEGRASFQTWLHTVARNEALMAIRRDKPTAEIDERSLGGARFSSVVVSRKTVNDAIAQLQSPYRETLQLQLDEQLDYDRIAQRLQIPVGTVRSRLAKARQLLGEQLQVEM